MISFIIPGSGTTSFAQEECCWNRQSTATPSLALHAANWLHHNETGEIIEFCRPDDSHGSKAMIFSWVFGDELERYAGDCCYLVANPSSAALEIGNRFPRAKVILASDCFSAIDRLDFTLLESWPNEFSSVLYQISSGCEHACPYCVWAHKAKRRDPILSAQEIQTLLAKYPKTASQPVHVLTNEITGCRLWLEDFCRTLGKGICWGSDGNVRNATLDDLTLAWDHGLKKITFGVEALDDELLIATSKGHTVEDAFQAFRWCEGLGLQYQFSLRQRIGETVEQLDRQITNLQRMRQLGLRPAKIIIGTMDKWPGNQRWEATEPKWSARYPRFVRSLGPNAKRLQEQWAVICGLAQAVVAGISASDRNIIENSAVPM